MSAEDTSKARQVNQPKPATQDVFCGNLDRTHSNKDMEESGNPNLCACVAEHFHGEGLLEDLRTRFYPGKGRLELQ
jgi:hypothetical protein